MPANLTPDYLAAEKRFRQASTITEKIACLEEMLMVMPRHKGTDHLRADLRRRISKLKNAARAKKSSRRESVFQIEKEGAGQVMVVGPANAGKSALVAALTNASPEISGAPYTTWRPCPGMMQVKDIQIQLVDTPALNQEYAEPAMVELIRRCDLVLIVVDLTADPVAQLEESSAWLEEHSVVPAQVGKRDGEERMIYIPFLTAANKHDDRKSDENLGILMNNLKAKWPVIGVSARTGRNLEVLKGALFDGLEVIRVYSKAPGREPDLSAPFILRQGSTVKDFAGEVHQDFAEKLKLARIWGKAVYDGQKVQRSHVLHDGDIVELHA